MSWSELCTRKDFALGIVDFNAELGEAAANEGEGLASDFWILVRDRDVVHVGEND